MPKPINLDYNAAMSYLTYNINAKELTDVS